MKILKYLINLLKKLIKKEQKMEKFLTDDILYKISSEYDIDFKILKAILKVETCGNGFLKEDTSIPTTLQEGHIFYKYAKQKGLNVEELCHKYPTICYPKWTKSFYNTGKKEYDRYLLAKSIDEECAMLSTSWGLGQCMGFNFKQCGYNTVKDFVTDMYVSEELQLRAMCNFIKNNNKMYIYLKQLNFKEFTRLYNGPGQVEYYSEKLFKAYNSI